MKKPFVSFIIPAYNVPVTLLRECIDSVLALSLSDEEREIIVVDDGSDISLQSVLSGEDGTLTLIRREHGGLSAARNAGIAASNGEYIQFVDGDDRLLGKAYEACISLIKSKKPDVLAFRFSRTDAPYRTPSFKKCGSGSTFMRRHNMRAAAWCYAFRRAILSDLTFDESVLLHEDELFTPQLFLRCKLLYTTDAVAYFYRVSAGSMTDAGSMEKNLFRLRSKEDVIVQLKAIAATLSATDRAAINRRIAQITMDLLYDTIVLTRDCNVLEQAMERLRSEDAYPLPRRCYTLKYGLFRLAIASPPLRRLLVKMIRR